MRKCLTQFSRIFEFGAVQKFVNLVDLVKSFQTSVCLQKSVLIQPRTGLSKFANDEPKVRNKVRTNKGRTIKPDSTLKAVFPVASIDMSTLARA
jgi:hypothetical protein